MNILVAAVLYLLVRQVGLLSRRLPEYGARDDHKGPGIGELAPRPLSKSEPFWMRQSH